MRVDWARFRPPGAASVVSPRFADLRAELPTNEESASDGISARKALLAAPPEERKEVLRSLLCDKLARVLGSSAAQLDADKPLTELGLDSLMAVELRNWIEGELSVNLPIVELMQGLSASGLAGVLLDQLDKDASAAQRADHVAQPVETAPAADEQAAQHDHELNGADDETISAQGADELLERLDDLSDHEVDALLATMEAEQGTGNDRPSRSGA